MDDLTLAKANDLNRQIDAKKRNLSTIKGAIGNIEKTRRFIFKYRHQPTGYEYEFTVDSITARSMLVAAREAEDSELDSLCMEYVKLKPEEPTE
jgi:hypothetical protein